MPVNLLLMVLCALGTIVFLVLVAYVKSLFNSRLPIDNKRHVYISDDTDIIELDYDDLMDVDIPLELTKDDEYDDNEFISDEVIDEIQLKAEQVTVPQLNEVSNIVQVAVKKSLLTKTELQERVIQNREFQQGIIELLNSLAGYLIRPKQQKPVAPVLVQTMTPPISMIRSIWRQVWLIALIVFAFGLYQLYPTIKAETISVYNEWQQTIQESRDNLVAQEEARRRNTQVLYGVVKTFIFHERGSSDSNITLVLKLDNRKENIGNTGLYTLRVVGEKSLLSLFETSLRNGNIAKFTCLPELKETRRGNIQVSEIAIIK